MKRYLIILLCFVLSCGACEFQKETKNRFQEDNKTGIYQTPSKTGFFWSPNKKITTVFKEEQQLETKQTCISNPHFITAQGDDLFIFDLDTGIVLKTDLELNITEELFRHSDLIGNNKVFGMKINADGVLCLAESRYLYIWKENQLTRYRNVHHISEFCLSGKSLYFINNDLLLGHDKMMVKEFDLDLNFIAAHISRENCPVSPEKIKGSLKLASRGDGFALSNILSNQYGYYSESSGSIEWYLPENDSFAARLDHNLEAVKLAEDMEAAPNIRYKSIYILPVSYENNDYFLVANEGRFTVVAIKKGSFSSAWISHQYHPGLVSSIAVIKEKGKPVFFANYVNSGKGTIWKYQ